MDNQEEAFIKTFIAEDKQERYLGFIKSSKRRNKFLDDFHHSIILRGAFAVEIPNRERSVEAVEQRLRQKGAGETTYVISPSSRLDQKTFLLKEALTVTIMQRVSAVICCLTGELAFFQSEDSAWILHRPKLKS